MPPISTDNRIFKAFRLEIAQSILRNNRHVSALARDIASHEHIIELCDTYAMRLLLAWLATKYGCVLPASTIDGDQPDVVPPPERFFLSFDIYPFLQNVELSQEAELFHTAKTFLDTAFGGQTPPIELAGSLYEHMTSFELELIFDVFDKLTAHIQSGSEDKYGRRQKGQFYTPPWVVDYCLEKSLCQDFTRLMNWLQQPEDIYSKDQADDQASQSPIATTSTAFSILDPACGTGNFLLGILRFLTEHNADSQQLFKAACHSLHGRDIDGKALGIAIWSIVLFLTGACHSKNRTACSVEFLIDKLRNNIRATDSIYESQGAKRASQNRFDLVITNPPYISYGSRNQEKLLATTSTFLRSNFPVSAEYKIRLNSIFQEVALNYVADGGKVCLFVPNSFLTGKGYSKLRAALVKKTRILSLSELPENTIKSAVVGRWCIAIYERDDSCDGALDYPVELVSLTSSANGSTSHFHTTYQLKASRLVTRDQSRFRLVFQSLDEELAIKLEALEPLSSVARGHTGIRARQGQRSIVADNQKDKQFRKGIKSGGFVNPFSVEWDGTWLKIDPNLLFAGGFDEVVVENPKIMVRQTADRIIAAYDESGLYHLNNVHSFSCRRVLSEREIDLHFLLALMNSNLWHYLYRIKTREDGRALAQIDIETVETMPLPQCKPGLTERISELSKELTENRSNLRRQELPIQINQLVYQAYGLDGSEVEHIEQCLGLRYNTRLLKTGAG